MCRKALRPAPAAGTLRAPEPDAVRGRSPDGEGLGGGFAPSRLHGHERALVYHGWPKRQEDDAAQGGASGNICLHCLNQYTSKFFQLTPFARGGLDWGHENKLLGAVHRKNPSHHGLGGSRRYRWA